MKNIVECLLFVSSKPVTSRKLSEVLGNVKEKEVADCIEELSKEYSGQNKPIFIQKVAGGWRFATKKEYGKWVKLLFSRETTYKLSAASLETLAIVAYRQPVTAQEIEAIRGVSGSGVLRGLFEKKLIKIAGRKQAVGRPILYKTTDRFLEYFGLDSISDLPPLEELGIEENIEELKDEGKTESD
ncbi:MAG: SMC-Scp complex subunit ScpB [Elusimicrobia bacterium]|nr:SMC-Scp complex subunit ScpB [Elusimicrobiota bacterium]